MFLNPWFLDRAFSPLSRNSSLRPSLNGIVVYLELIVTDTVCEGPIILRSNSDICSKIYYLISNFSILSLGTISRLEIIINSTVLDGSRAKGF